MASHLDAGLQLLDRQILDRHGHPIGKVDDIELTEPSEDDPPMVTALLIGPQAFGPRIGGRLGRWIVGIARRLSPAQGPTKISLNDVTEIGVTVRVGLAAEDLTDVLRLERWLRTNLVSRIPGADRATG